jgi:hypothetical protein
LKWFYATLLFHTGLRFWLDFYEKSLQQITYWSVALGELDAETYSEADNRVPTQWVWLGSRLLNEAAAGTASGTPAPPGREDLAVRSRRRVSGLGLFFVVGKLSRDREGARFRGRAIGP